MNCSTEEDGQKDVPVLKSITSSCDSEEHSLGCSKETEQNLQGRNEEMLSSIKSLNAIGSDLDVNNDTECREHFITKKLEDSISDRELDMIIQSYIPSLDNNTYFESDNVEQPDVVAQSIESLDQSTDFRKHYDELKQYRGSKSRTGVIDSRLSEASNQTTPCDDKDVFSQSKSKIRKASKNTLNNNVLKNQTRKHKKHKQKLNYNYDYDELSVLDTDSIIAIESRYLST